MKKIALSILVLLTTTILNAQNSPFNIAIEPMNIPNLGGIQSFAFGQDNGKWLIVGGRIDGLHRRQPFAAFDVAGNNNQLIIVDPLTQQKWSAPLSSLPTGIQEQLSATNAEFFQEGDYLYIAGGYGYSATASDHITYSNLTAIDVPNVINAIINNASLPSYFRQITDSQFAVTGGRLEKIYNTYYLVGGQKFMGRYNPMGPTHGPGFIQEYTNQIRKFTLSDDGTNLTINHLPVITDSTNLHRRDYNVIAQIMPNEEQGLTAFSGVFQYDADLPFLDCVNIDSSGYEVDTSFWQYYNHYHCANIPLYSKNSNEMHNLFFGGIAQYYENQGILVQDNDVPFVKTIARVSRNSNGTMNEYKLPIEMPTYLGAGSEFIPIEDLPQYDNSVLKLDSLTADSVLLGYIYGGISSSAKNIFWINTGSQSSASSQIFKVYLINNTTSTSHIVNDESRKTLKLKVFPNPNNGVFSVEFSIIKNSSVKIFLRDINGKIVDERIEKEMTPGTYQYSNAIKDLGFGSVYFLTVETDYEFSTRKIIIEP